MPISAPYRPERLFEELGPEFADPVAPARFPQHDLRWRNDAWAERVGLGALTPLEWESHFSRFAPLPGGMPTPLAMRYHGHQFRTYNPQIGDGRGFLYAQLRDDAGRLLDLGTKGSGQTPYSRFGDGRLTLKGGLREVLAARMLEALGVYTSKAFSLFETGEALVRGDEPSPTRSSVLVRLSHSHIRFGTFQRLAFLERADLIHTLIEHVCACYYPQFADFPAEERAGALFGSIVETNARLAGSWMAAGFVHGVLNTDNLNVTGESFDYGPWRFVTTSDPSFTAAYFDETGLYAFGRQPEAVSWALAQLGSALSLVAPVAALEAGLGRFIGAYQAGLRDAMFRRLNLQRGALDLDISFVSELFGWLTESQAGWDQFFHDWFGGGASAARAEDGPQAAKYAGAAFDSVRAGLLQRTKSDATLNHPYWQRSTPHTLLIGEVETLWTPIAGHDDWSGFTTKLSQITELSDALGASPHARVAGAS